MQPIDFPSWLRLGLLVPVNKKVKFPTDDDLWEGIKCKGSVVFAFIF